MLLRGRVVASILRCCWCYCYCVLQLLLLALLVGVVAAAAAVGAAAAAAAGGAAVCGYCAAEAVVGGPLRCYLFFYAVV